MDGNGWPAFEHNRYRESIEMSFEGDLLPRWSAECLLQPDLPLLLNIPSKFS